MQRFDSQAAERAGTPRLKAECVIDLVTVRDTRRKAPEGKQG
jgi:hypothetical protein